MPKLTWLPNKTFELQFTIPWEQVKDSYQKNLKVVAEQTTIEGFRKGKAPLEMVEKRVDKSKLYSAVLEDLLPQTYFSAVKQHNLQPIIDPKIIPLSTEEGKDWTFKAIACETPDVVLGDYEAKIRQSRAKDKKVQKTQEQSLKEIFDILLATSQASLSPVLIEQETKRMLSRLLSETQKLGLTLNEYLQANKKTVEQLREEHNRLAKETLSLEFILSKIADKKNVSVTEAEIQAIIKAIPDTTEQKKLDTPPQKAYISSILRKRKVIDFLSKI